MTWLAESQKPSPSCLSAYEISRFVAGEISGPARTAIEGRLEGCEHCRQLVDQERHDWEAVQDAILPQWLREPSEHQVFWRQWFRRPILPMGFGALATAAVAAVWFVIPVDRTAPQPGERLKGAMSVTLSVMRGDRLVHDSVAAAEIAILRPQDRLRIAVHGAPWVRVEGWEDNQWADYYRGRAGAEGWLPIGVRITAVGETKLRVFGCQNEIALQDPGESADCTAGDFHYEVQ